MTISEVVFVVEELPETVRVTFHSLVLPLFCTAVLFRYKGRAELVAEATIPAGIIVTRRAAVVAADTSFRNTLFMLKFLLSLVFMSAFGLLTYDLLLSCLQVLF
jgi:hypothetical protein